MIPNKKVINYKVVDLFKYYNFRLDLVSIRDNLKNKKIQIICSGARLKKITTITVFLLSVFLKLSPVVFLLTVDLRKQRIKIYLYKRFIAWAYGTNIL